jgi:hypothetical protein
VNPYAYDSEINDQINDEPLEDWLNIYEDREPTLAQRVSLLAYAVKQGHLPAPWAALLAGERAANAQDMANLLGVFESAGMTLDHSTALRLATGSLYFMQHLTQILEAFRRDGGRYFASS